MSCSTRLIINADDYGRTPSISAGIRKGHCEGIITTTTAMMNSPSVNKDLRLVLEECPRLAVGAHLILTTGRPLRPGNKVRSLVTLAGNFLSHKELPMLFKYINKTELRDEWRAQIEALLSAGLGVDHLDSHHHVSYLYKVAFEVMLELAEEYNVPIRHPLCFLDMVGEDTGEISKDLAALATKFIPRVLHSRAVVYPDRTFTSFYGKRATLATLLRIIKTLPNGNFEVMCHPGFDDYQPQFGYTNSARERELAILVNPQVQEIIMHRHIRLITFGQL